MKKIDGEGVTFAKFKFVPTIGLGNIITFVGMIMMGSTVWFGLVNKVDATSALNVRNEKRLDTLTYDSKVNSERIGKIEVAITFIAPALQRIEEKVSKR